MKSKFTKNKRGEKFSSGIIVILLSMTIFAIAFISEGNKITGFAVSTESSNFIVPHNLIEFKDIKSLEKLASGNYYVDIDGIVYWLDDNSKPAIAKVNFVDEGQENRHIYIDDQGRIGYVLNPVSIK